MPLSRGTRLILVLCLLAGLLPLAGALAQPEGSTVTDELTAANLLITYTFTGQQGDVVTISLTSEAFDSFLILTDAAGDELISDDDSGGAGNAIITDFALPAAGEYHIIVTSFNGVSTGQFTLTVEGATLQTPDQATAVAPTLAPAAPTPTAPPVVPGEAEVFEGTLTAEVAAALYTFNGAAGSEVTITLESTDFDAYLILLDPGGRQIISDDDSAGNRNARIEAFSLPEDGTYTIQASSLSGASTGAYTLTVESADAEPVEPVAQPTAQSAATSTPTPAPQIVTQSGGAIDLNARVTGTLPDGQTLTYTFESGEGQPVMITLESGDFDPYLTLSDANGTVLATDDDSAGSLNARIEFTIEGAGSYNIVVSSVGAFGGEFTLSLAAAAVQSTAEPGETTLTVGSTVSGTLEAGSPVDFTFAGAAGESITITLESTDFDPFLTLLDPGGSVLTTDDDSAGSLNARISDYLLPSGGVYTVRVTSFSNAASGAFTLTLTGSAGGDTTPTPIPTGQATVVVSGSMIQIGATVESALAAAGDTATFTFEGAAGEVVTITLTSDEFDPFLTLSGPDGAVLTTDDDSAGNLDSRISDFSLPADGIYTITVSSFDGNNAGDYVLTLAGQGAAGATPTPTPFTGGEGDITIGSSVNGEFTGRNLEYTFQGETGQLVTITLTSEDFDTYLRLQDASGFDLATDDDSAGNLDSRISLFRLPNTGSYTIVVESFDGEDGAFTLTLSAAVLADIEYGQVVQGQLEIAATTGYRFTGNEGDVIVASLESPQFDTYLTLTQSGTSYPLIEDDDSGTDTNSLIGPYTLESGGEYILSVRSYSSSGGGAYTLRLDRAELVPVTYGTPVDVTFGGDRSSAFFSFEGTSGDILNITVDSNGGVDTSLSVNAPSNYQVISDDDGGAGFDPEVLRLVLNETGRYTILLQAVTPGASGTVTLTVGSSPARSLDQGPQVVNLSDKVTLEVLEFNGTAGETVQLTATVLSSAPNAAPNLLVQQNGVTIASANASTVSAVTISFTVPQDGRVTVQVSDYNYAGASIEITLGRQ